MHVPGGIHGCDWKLVCMEVYVIDCCMPAFPAHICASTFPDLIHVLKIIEVCVVGTWLLRYIQTENIVCKVWITSTSIPQYSEVHRQHRHYLAQVNMIRIRVEHYAGNKGNFFR